jgi:hypothetical protein
MCRFSDAGMTTASTRLWRPASKKRQGTKSREVAHWRCNGRYGDLMAAPISIVHAHLKLVHVIPDRHPLSLVVGLSVKISQWMADLIFEKKIFDDRMRGYIVTHNVDFFSVRSRYRLHIADQPKRRRTLCLREISLPHELDRREQFPVDDKTARSSPNDPSSGARARVLAGSCRLRHRHRVITPDHAFRSAPSLACLNSRGLRWNQIPLCTLYGSLGTKLRLPHHLAVRYRECVL